MLKRTGGINWPYVIIYGELAWTVSKKWSWHAHHGIFFRFLLLDLSTRQPKDLDPWIQRRCMSGTHGRQLLVEFTPFLSSSETTLLCKFGQGQDLILFAHKVLVVVIIFIRRCLYRFIYLPVYLSYLSMYWYISIDPSTQQSIISLSCSMYPCLLLYLLYFPINLIHRS